MCARCVENSTNVTSFFLEQCNMCVFFFFFTVSNSFSIFVAFLKKSILVYNRQVITQSQNYKQPIVIK